MPIGDSVLLDKVLVTAVESADTPEMLVLGDDATRAYASVLQARLASLETWRPVSESTGVDA